MTKKTNDNNTPLSIPFFSVVLTTHNRAKLLNRALHSLIIQTEKDWEAIVVDDGSTDDTFAQIFPLLKLNQNITYIRQGSKGCAASKNTGIFASSGRYITFLDSDDEYSPEHLITRKATLSQHPDIDLLHGGIKIIGSPFVPNRFDASRMIHLDECVTGGTFFIKRELALALKGFEDIPLGHDADFLERAEALGAHLSKTTLPTYIYHRETQNSITNNLTIYKNS